MVEAWLVVGFVTAVPLFTYVVGLALLSKLLRKERPLALVVKQATQCQASKNGPHR